MNDRHATQPHLQRRSPVVRCLPFDGAYQAARASTISTERSCRAYAGPSIPHPSHTCRTGIGKRSPAPPECGYAWRHGRPRSLKLHSRVMVAEWPVPGLCRSRRSPSLPSASIVSKASVISLQARPISVSTRRNWGRLPGHQWLVPVSPLNGPTISSVTQPPWWPPGCGRTRGRASEHHAGRFQRQANVRTRPKNLNHSRAEFENLFQAVPAKSDQ